MVPLSNEVILNISTPLIVEFMNFVGGLVLSTFIIPILIANIWIVIGMKPGIKKDNQKFKKVA